MKNVSSGNYWAHDLDLLLRTTTRAFFFEILPLSFFISKFNILNHTCSCYLRIEAKDLPGVLSSITKNFAKNKISIKNLIQVPEKRKKKASIIIITHKNLEKNFNNLLLNLKRNKFVLKKPIIIS